MVTEIDIVDICPLAPMQRLFLAAAALSPELAKAQLRYEIQGPLSIEALEQAWRHLVVRHSILRTAVVTEDVDEPLQVVLRDPKLRFDVEDLTSEAEAEQERRIAAYLREDRARPIDRNKPPLMHVRLFRTAPHRHLLCWSFERLLLDGWSLKLLLDEMSQAYRAFSAGRIPDLPSAAQFRDFLQWLESRDFGDGAAYWRHMLAGCGFEPLFAASQPRRESQALHAWRRRTVPAAAVAELQRCARNSRVTLSTLVEAAWALVLGAWSGRHDILFGFTVTGRPADLPGVERMAGMFTNNLPRRVRLWPEEDAAVLLGQFSRQQAESSAFEQMPITDIQNAAGVPGNRRLFETLVVCNGIGGSGMPELGPGLTFTDQSEMLPSGYAATLNATPGSGGLPLTISYNPQLIDGGAAEALVGAVSVLLERLASPATNSTVSDLLALAAATLGPSMPARTVPHAVSAARDAVELQIVGLFQQGFGRRDIGASDDFFALGGHSLLAVWLFGKLEEVSGRKLPLALLLEHRTPAALAALLRSENYAPSWSSLVPIHPGGTRLPLFCIHGGGGNVLFYRELAARLGEDQPFYALQPQGMDGTLPTHTTVEEMAEHYISEIRQLQGEGPYRLGGTSFGGMVAFEMARRLSDQGHEVGLVAFFDTHGPGYPRYRHGISRWQRRVFRAWERVYFHGTNLILLDNPGRWEYLKTKYAKGKHMLRLAVKRSRKRLRRQWRELLGQELPPDLVRTQNAILHALESYQPGYYDGEITLFRATRQPLGIVPDRTLGWAPYARSVRVIDVEGYHTGIILEPHVRLNVDKFRAALERDTSAGITSPPEEAFASSDPT